jgi:hypothetical protein
LEILGRFSTTAKLGVSDAEKLKKESPFEWFEFKFGEKRAGELLAVFELIEVNSVNSSIYISYSKISIFFLEIGNKTGRFSTST